MIVPVDFSIKHEDEPEGFAFSLDDVQPRWTYERIRVTLVVMDTETGEANGFSALVLFDQSAEPYHELMTLFRRPAGEGLPTWASPGYVRELRDALNDLLGES